MKKLLLVAIAAGITTASFAERTKTLLNEAPGKRTYTNVAAKTTAVGDTTAFSNILTGDTLAIYYAGSNSDSGFRSGMNSFGDKGFAENYQWGYNDSTIKVLGVIARFGGTFQSTSTKTVSFKCWSQGPVLTTSNPNLFFDGKPTTELATVSAPITGLGIGTAGGPDTLKAHYFTTPTADLHFNFFVGYTIAYDPAAMGGDTIAVYSNQQGERHTPVYTVNGTDTLIHVQNAILQSDNNWYDNFTQSWSLYNHFSLFPIVKTTSATGLTNITKNELTFKGTIPNPAVNATSAVFSLAKASDVTIAITDINGKTIQTNTYNNLEKGEHSINLNVSDLASGNYLMMIRTSTGVGFANMFSIAK